MTSKHRLALTCAKGIVPFLMEEVLLSGFPILSESVSAIETEGTLADAMTLNLTVRTAQRVLLLLREFKTESPEELYREIYRIPWENYLEADGYFCVTSSVDSPSVRDSRFANVKCKDAVVDRFNEKFGRRPDSGSARDRVVIHLYWQGERCRVFLDTSGEPLSRRGYRRLPFKAPMQETLAAAVMMATAWDGNGNLINPMCGSGTIAIEGALIGLGRVPGLLRTNFGFMHLKGFDESLWNQVRKRVRGRARKSIKGKIIATDIDPEAVEAARQNAATAGVGHVIEFKVCDYAETPIPEGGGVVLLNPPYGERLGEIEQLKAMYQGIGDFFKKRCQGYNGYLLTGNLNLSKKIGLRTRRRLPFFNGEIECRLLEYELYEGSKKPGKILLRK
jgi:23S rRNA G2445 N2-methylase RlmL